MWYPKKEQFEQLVNDNIKLIYWAANRGLKGLRYTPEERDVFIQEVFLYIMDKGYSFDSKIASFSTWVYWQTKHVRSLFVRNKKLEGGRKGVPIDGLPVASKDRGPEEEASSKDGYQHLLRIVDNASRKMTDLQKSMFEAAIIREIPVREIARKRRVHHNSIHNNLTTCRAKIADAYFREKEKYARRAGQSTRSTHLGTSAQ